MYRSIIKKHKNLRTVKCIKKNIRYHSLGHKKIAIDIDLIDGRANFVRHIVKTYKMTPQNYRILAAFNTINFFNTLKNYTCDICDKRCSRNNPIHTNKSIQGCDICDKCMKSAMVSIKPLSGWNPDPVYSLKDIVINSGRYSK